MVNFTTHEYKQTIQVGDQIQATYSGEWLTVTAIEPGDHCRRFVTDKKTLDTYTKVSDGSVIAARRNGLVFGGTPHKELAKPLTDYEPVQKHTYQAESKGQRARRLYPDFDWDEYDRLSAISVERARAFLNAHKNNRRLGGKSEALAVEEMTMEEKSLVAQGTALQKTAWDSVDEVKRLVLGAYGNGNSALTANQQTAIVAIAWSMQLDPSPGVGHIYAWTDPRNDNRLIVTVGYQGLLFKAQQQHQFFYNPPRPMTDAERAVHGLGAQDVGAICELYEMKRARMAKELGLPIVPIQGVGIWRGFRSVEKTNKKGETYIKETEDNIASSKSAFWMACKNAIKDAVRQLGIGFGSMQPPQIDGFQYDHKEDAYYEVSNPHEQPATQTEPPAPITDEAIEEGIFEAMVANQPEPVASEAPQTPEPAPSDRPYAPDVLARKFQQAVNSAIESKKASAKPIGTKKADALIKELSECNERPSTTTKFVLHLTGADDPAGINEAQELIFRSKLMNFDLPTLQAEICQYVEAHKLVSEEVAKK